MSLKCRIVSCSVMCLMNVIGTIIASYAVCFLMTYRLISVNNCLLSLLTYIFTGAEAFLRSFYGPGTGPVHVDNIYCTGSEVSLSACTRKRFGDVSTSCLDHFNDASVSCLSELFC